MTPYYQKNDITIYHGDLREVLPSLPSVVDHVVTDPPYGLSFMERGWDQAVPGPDYWRAIRAVCKPGALLLAFGGTRTYHRLTCAIEDAEWEIRDCLMWLHGQGFPKAADVGKMIDKAAGAEREVLGPMVYAGGHVQNHGGGKQGFHEWKAQGVQMVDAPATDAAKKWTGWANALKPAWEPIVLAMKALDGTQAHNALTWGVAGMNIDACRISCDSRPLRVVAPLRPEVEYCGNALQGRKDGSLGSSKAVGETAVGRWPANLLLDEEVAHQLDAQTGTLTSGSDCIRTKAGDGYHGGMGKAGDVQVSYGDSGGASRFFYCGKATKKERGEGNDHPTVKPLTLMQYLLTLLSTPTGGLILDPFAGSGTTALAARDLGRSCVGVELDEHNCEIIARRLDGYSPN